MIIDQHQPIVDKYYGEGKMLVVVGRLMGECDRVVKGLVEGWEEERGVQRKVASTLFKDLSIAHSFSVVRATSISENHSSPLTENYSGERGGSSTS